MRKIGLRLGALLLGAGLIFIVFKGDDSAPERSTTVEAAALPAAMRTARTLEWRGTAGRFEAAAVIEKKESFARAETNAIEKVVVEIVKTQSKYPYIRVETHFRFDAQAQAWVPGRPIEYVADQVLVELKAGAQYTNALAAIEGRIIQTHTSGESTLVLVGLPKPTVDAVPSAIRKLAQFPDVFAVVEPHLIRRGTRTPNDPEYQYQWSLPQINAPAAWDITTGSATVVVAVIDSGIDFTHSDLGQRVWANPGETANNFRDDDLNGYLDDYRGYNFAYENNNPSDDETRGHGTFVSGVIGAAGNNANGIAGICWNVKIMPVKVMNSFGMIYAIDFIRGLDYARFEGAKIINCSLGGAFGSQSEQDALSRLRSAGALVVAAAGNDGSNNDIYPIYPASYPHDNIIAVTHSGQSDNLTFDSNFGASSVDLAAPGEAIWSTARGNSYRSGGGSSFAAPHVTGVAALLKAQNPSRGYANIKNAIIGNVDKRAALTGRTVGGGRLNAYEALIPRLPLADALDATSLTWTTGGNRPWFGQTLSSSDGVDSARCGNIADSQSSWVQTIVTGPGVLSFQWRVSSEPGLDFLRFTLNGQMQGQITGESGWLPQTMTLPAGNHTLRWTYLKDSSIAEGEDKGWLDRVVYLRDTGGPTITITSPTGTNVFATDVLLQGTASDLFGVQTMEYRVGAGPWLPISTSDGFTNWQAQLTNLALGTNVVRVRAVDTFNQTSIVSRTYIVLSSLTVNVAGCGAVPAKFAGTTWQEAGKTLSIRAFPCAGNLFTHWSGDIPSSNVVLTFVMRPNLTLQANFVSNRFASVAGVYHGLFHEAAGVLHESSGVLRVSVTETGVFSGVLIGDGATNNFAGAFDLATGSRSLTVPRAGKSPLQVSLQLDFADQMTGQIGNGTWTADLLADRRGFTPTNPPPFAGMYTLVFPGEADFTASPSGHGFATATVDTAGRVSIDGRMGDNVRIQQTTFISKDGDWPFYAPMYTGNRGSVLGWMKFLLPRGLTNQLTSWIRPSLPTAYYPHGFSNELSAVGSPYVVPAGRRVIDCTNALLILSGADFANPITNQMVLTANNAVQNLGPANVAMKIVVTNGTFSGTISRPVRTNAFLGVFLQQQNIGLGYFIGSNYIGEVRFEPAP